MTIERTFALLLLGVVAANVAIFVSRARKHARPDEPDPGLRIVHGSVVWIAPPFLLMAFGMISGLSGLNPAQPGQPQLIDYVTFALVLATFVRGSVWMFRQQGAEFVADHQILNRSPSAAAVKFWWVVLVLGSSAAWVFNLIRANR